MTYIDDSVSFTLKFEEKNSEREIGSYVIREKPKNNFLYRTIIRINNGFYLVNSSFSQFNQGVLELDSVYMNFEKAKDKALDLAKEKLIELTNKHKLSLEKESKLEKTVDELVLV
ncbi:MAG: hypothetical protein AABX29_05750 [Nanoarchaeota archaeon]